MISAGRNWNNPRDNRSGHSSRLISTITFPTKRLLLFSKLNKTRGSKNRTHCGLYPGDQRKNNTRVTPLKAVNWDTVWILALQNRYKPTPAKINRVSQDGTTEGLPAAKEAVAGSSRFAAGLKFPVFRFPSRIAQIDSHDPFVPWEIKDAVVKDGETIYKTPQTIIITNKELIITRIAFLPPIHFQTAGRKRSGNHFVSPPNPKTTPAEICFD